MTRPARHKWTFAARFRRHSFGWRSQTPIKRIREAVKEIRAMTRKDPLLGAEGAVRLLEKLSPALEQVDSSSGAIGNAVNNAISALVPVIANAPADDNLRGKWLERLWKAIEVDDMPYLELLPEYWGVLCHSPELASRWADEFAPIVREAWSQDQGVRGRCFKGTDACLSALFRAGRYKEILELLDLAPHKSWDYRKWGVKALVAMGENEEAIHYAEDSRGLNEPDSQISEACEEILLADGRFEDAYRHYAIEANQKATYLATFRTIAKKYPNKEPGEILSDLVSSSPGSEGKWFAAARSAGLYPKAIELANKSPCDPKTLTRAARDMKSKEPRFAMEAGMAALRWLLAGYGYEVTGHDVLDAYDLTIEAAENAGCDKETLERIRIMVASKTSADHLVVRILGARLGLAINR